MHPFHSLTTSSFVPIASQLQVPTRESASVIFYLHNKYTNIEIYTMWSLPLGGKTFGAIAVLGTTLLILFALLLLMLHANAKDGTAIGQSMMDQPQKTKTPVLMASWSNHNQSNNYRYVYEPSLLPLPPGVNLEHKHEPD